MELIQKLSSELISPIVSALILAAILYWFKLPQLLRDNTEAIKRLTEKVTDLFSDVQSAHNKIAEHQRRHEISQKLFSDILQHPVDTLHSSMDFDKYPPTRVFDKFRPKDD